MASIFPIIATFMLERNDYYPYGGLFGETGDVQPLKYSRKELERDNGLNLYDFHARLFDYAIPAFSSQDMIQEKYQWISPYTYCAANPIRFVDPSGLHPVWNGKYGEESAYYESTNQKTVSWQEVENYIKTGNYNGENNLKFSDSEDNHSISPFRLGIEWLTGSGERNRVFTSDDDFTKLLKTHKHINSVKTEIIKIITSNTPEFSGECDYRLSGFSGIWKYLKDYSTLLTFGHTGNLAVTYLGSYKLSWGLLSVSNNSATVLFEIKNTSSIASGLRPPVIGYSKVWNNSIGTWLNTQASKYNLMDKTTQRIIWIEDLKF